MNKGKRSAAFILLLILVLAGWFSTSQVVRPLAAEATSQYEELQLFTDVLSLVRKSYVEDVGTRDLIYGAINGMLASLDPHSGFMTPDVFREMQIDTRGEFGGLGIEITVKDGILTVVSPIEDTPAYRAGLKAGDQIFKIEDKFTKEMSVMDAVKLMRGPKGTEITISVMREAFEKPKEFTLVRETIKVKSVKARMLENGFGYVRLAQFQERTGDDLRQALKSLRSANEGDLQGLILDLRNNPGGLLDQAVEVADLFLSEGMIVYTEGREKGSQMQFTAHRENTEPFLPMVILINDGSASASEIVAGALKDHKRAIIMGIQSFGKGSVQTIIPLSDSSGLRLTTARYFTPAGTSIQARGITPDIVVKPMELREPDEGAHFREKDLENHFELPESPARSEKPINEGHFSPSEKDREDYQLMRALDLLKGWLILKTIERPAA